MTRSENELRAKRIVRFFLNEANQSKKITFQHFSAEGVSKSTLYCVLKRYRETGNDKYKTLSGRPRTVATPDIVHRTKRSLKSKPGTSVRVLAAKMGISKSTLSRIKTKDLNIKARVKKTVPRYFKDQSARAKSGARFVLDKKRRKVLVIDDETYVVIDPEDVPGRKFYHCTNPADVSYDEKTKKKTKFFKKYLVWQAIDQFGNVSDPYITTGTINGKIYLNECLRKRLLPFINKFHSPHEILFWPDLATSHYSKDVLQYLEQQNIEIVPKKKNPPNLPQCRPIEQFWAICKQKYSKLSRKPKNLNGFKRIWNNIATKVAQDHGRKLMEHGNKMLTQVSKNGVES